MRTISYCHASSLLAFSWLYSYSELSICSSFSFKLHSFAGGWSIGCPWNAGASGTYFDDYMLSLRVDNDNITTETETPLLDFSTTPLWTNVYVENNAKVLVPLLWTRVQVLKLYLF